MKQKSMNNNECRTFIAKAMRNAGYNERDISMFLAGATMLGYLDDDRASWAREFLTRKFFADLEPFDKRITAAGVIYQIKKSTGKRKSKKDELL